MTLKLDPTRNAGWPDRLVIGPTGVVAFIELKRDAASRLRPIQRHVHAELARRRVIVAVIHSWPAWEQMRPALFEGGAPSTL